MSGTGRFSCVLLTIWVALSFPSVNGTRNAGHCSSSEFWYEPIRDCIPLGGRSSQSAPSNGVTCPVEGSWYWSKGLSACLPTSPVSIASSPGSMTCPSNYAWDATRSLCSQTSHVQRSASCGADKFWFSQKLTCLPVRDSSAPTTRCPSEWYWDITLDSCVPTTPEALSNPTCRGYLVWSQTDLICQFGASLTQSSPSGAPSARPSSSSSQQRSRRQVDNEKSRTLKLCPAELDACPILRVGDLSDYECVDPKYDLQHCGGCSLDGRGEDCTTIKGAWNVECAQAHCSVLTCRAGYTPSVDRRTCVKF